MGKYVCAYCGKTGNTPTHVVSGKCMKSPSGAHRVIMEQSAYVCKYCGKKGNSPFHVVSGGCIKSPHKQHELMG